MLYNVRIEEVSTTRHWLLF